MQLEAEYLVIGAPAIGRSNTGIPPPSAKKMQWATAPEEQVARDFKPLFLIRTAIRPKRPEEGNSYE